MMNKIFINTSRQEYKTPLLSIDELEKHDVLTVSGLDNGNAEGSEITGKNDAFDGYTPFVE